MTSNAPVLTLLILVIASEIRSQLQSELNHAPLSQVQRTRKPSSGISFGRGMLNETPKPDDINYRAHYRNLYRNSNFFAPKESSRDELPYVATPQGRPSSSNTLPTRSTAKTPIVEVDPKTMFGAVTPAYDESNEPILFEDATQYSTYVRPVEPVASPPPATDNTISTKTKPKSDRFAHVETFQPIPGGQTAPDCAQDAVYCEDLDNYPKNILNEVLQRNISPEEFQKLYGDSTDNSTKIIDLKSIVQRAGLQTGPLVEETPLCSAVEHTIYPRVAKNKENKWMFVVNHDEYIQGVRVEKCLDEGQSCFYGNTGPTGYETACRQKYIYKKLLALTPEGKTSTESFKLPSCCSCYVKTQSITDRIFGTKTNQRSSTPSESERNEDASDEFGTTIAITKPSIL